MSERTFAAALRRIANGWEGPEQMTEREMVELARDVLESAGMTEPPSEHWSERAQKAAEERLAYCQYLLWSEEGGDDEPWDGVVSEPVGIFCGCDTCVVREVLDAAWPVIAQARLEAGELAEVMGAWNVLISQKPLDISALAERLNPRPTD